MKKGLVFLVALVVIASLTIQNDAEALLSEDQTNNSAATSNANHDESNESFENSSNAAGETTESHRIYGSPCKKTPC